MPSPRTLTAIILALTGLLLVASAPAAAADAYVVVDVGGGKHGTAAVRGINAFGQTVGGAGEAHGGNISVFFWPGAGAMRELDRLHNGDYSEGFGINDLGQIVGAANTSQSLRPFLYTPSSGMRDLGVLPGDVAGKAYAINSSGQTAGFSSGARGMHAVLWDGGIIRDLGTLRGGNFSEARDINSRGDVVGLSDSSSGTEAFLWTASSGMVAIGTLPNHTSSVAHAINDTRQVVGTSSGPLNSHAFLWTEKNGMAELGTLAGGDHSEAFDINSAGQVVGTSGSSLGIRAFIWSADAGMRDLNTLVPNSSNLILIAAVGINQRGEIVAIGSRHHDLANDRETFLDEDPHAGNTRVYVLKPVGQFRAVVATP